MKENLMTANSDTMELYDRMKFDQDIRLLIALQLALPHNIELESMTSTCLLHLKKVKASAFSTR